jgi:hypothetical protein
MVFSAGCCGAAPRALAAAAAAIATAAQMNDTGRHRAVMVRLPRECA